MTPGSKECEVRTTSDRRLERATSQMISDEQRPLRQQTIHSMPIKILKWNHLSRSTRSSSSA